MSHELRFSSNCGAETGTDTDADLDALIGLAIATLCRKPRVTSPNSKALDPNYNSYQDTLNGNQSRHDHGILL